MAGSLTTGALVVALLAETAVVAGLVVSIVRPARRVWPPGEVSWRFWYYWGAAGVAAGSLAGVAVLDAGTFVFAPRVWNWMGTGMLVLGAGLTAWAGRTLRLRESIGVEAGLQTDGPYRYSRNPQLVGISTAVLGLLLVVNSTLLVVGVLPAVLWLLLLPRAEEPWLCQQFGDEYEAYCDEVPRFVGRKSVRRLIEAAVSIAR